MLQGLKFDPTGDYVRTYIPELGHVSGVGVHEPWKTPDAYSHGYAQPVIDLGSERDEALRRLDEIKR